MNQKLLPVNDIIHKYARLRCASKVKTLAMKLASESIFGDDVLFQCTVAGDRDLPGLPVRELAQLKKIILLQLPQFWQTPYQFEPVWKDCLISIGQACKRLRLKH